MDIEAFLLKNLLQFLPLRPLASRSADNHSGAEVSDKMIDLSFYMPGKPGERGLVWAEMWAD